MNEKPTVSFPVRMSQELDAKLTAASKVLGLSKQDVIRLAMAVGLEDLRRCNYDLASAVVDAAKGRQPVSRSALSVAAEDSPEIRPEGCIPPKVQDVNYKRIKIRK